MRLNALLRASNRQRRLSSSFGVMPRMLRRSATDCWAEMMRSTIWSKTSFSLHTRASDLCVKSKPSKAGWRQLRFVNVGAACAHGECAFFLRIDSESEYNEVADESATPEQRAVLAGVYRTLDSLPANERIAWSLRYVEGEKLERVAELCGCSLATAKRRIKSAHETIQREQGGSE